MPIRIVHVTAPGCSWSWGYEPVFQRLRAVYGEQVPIDLVIDCPYTDFDQWMKDYEMASWDEAMAFFREGKEKMGLPMVEWTKDTLPWDVLPASLAAIAAGRQGPPHAGRFLRILTRRINLEGQGPTPGTLRSAAQEAGLDVARFEKDLADEESLLAEYGDQGVHVPHVPMGFYNLVLTDDESRTLILDHAFDPKVVESALDWMSGGTLRKSQPTDVVRYAAEEGPVSQVEVERVFALAPRDALSRLEAGEKAGRLARVTLAGAPHWRKAA